LLPAVRSDARGMLMDRAKAWLNLINLSAAYKKCFLAEDGKLTPAAERVLRDLGHHGHMSRTTMKVSPVTRSVDTHASALAEGRRDIVRRIWAYIDLDPTAHPLTKETNHDD
jgi:hypothetical protein